MNNTYEQSNNICLCAHIKLHLGSRDLYSFMYMFVLADLHKIHLF